MTFQVIVKPAFPRDGAFAHFHVHSANYCFDDPYDALEQANYEDNRNGMSVCAVREEFLGGNCIDNRVMYISSYSSPTDPYFCIETL